MMTMVMIIGEMTMIVMTVMKTPHRNKESKHESIDDHDKS